MSDDEEIGLSAAALAALGEFRREETERIEQFEKLQAQALAKFDEAKAADAQADVDFAMDVFQEDWNLSQFWYSDATATTLASALLEGLPTDRVARIALVSAPTVYHKLRTMLAGRKDVELYLLEHDDRFRVFGTEYIFYDFNEPLRNLNDPRTGGTTPLKGTIDRILVDPPFLSDECHTKTAITARVLLNAESPARATVVCTGNKVEDIVERIYPGIRRTTFRPEHARGLSNEFRCYATSECAQWKFE
ncbi:protein-lysine N-methyltransferase [Dipodascopsis tothii]|uniref:protein-lysine N-methyltransferase n=1 Tax=Dipodascopsis tothii TaxID=44089 RepID=UPI0034CEA884